MRPSWCLEQLGACEVEGHGIWVDAAGGTRSDRHRPNGPVKSLITRHKPKSRFRVTKISLGLGHKIKPRTNRTKHMPISKFTLIHMNQINISNHKISPREEVETSHYDDDGRDSEFNDFAEDSGFFVQENDDDSDSEFNEFVENFLAKDVGWLVQERTTKRRSSVKKPSKEPEARGISTTKHTVRMKETLKQKKRSSVKAGGSRIINKPISKTKSQRITKQDFKRRVRDTIGRDSLQLHHNQLERNRITASKALETWNF